MNTTYHSFETLPLGQQQVVASLVSEFTYAHEELVAVKPDVLMQRHAGFVALRNEQFAGYIGADEPRYYDHKLLTKVGSLVVMPEYQNNGVSIGLIHHITKDVVSRSQVPYAFCNELSELSFKRCGYVAPEEGQLPFWIQSTLGNKPFILPVEKLPRPSYWI